VKLNYFPDTDSLYVDLSHKQSTESQEVSKGWCWITTLKEI